MGEDSNSDANKRQIPTIKVSPVEECQDLSSQPLIGDEWIRLLEIQVGEPDDPIYVKIFTVRISDSPPYEALSYTWGDPSQREQIQISSVGPNGEQIAPSLVTTNCHAALKQLRNGITSPRTVWVDAICINQAHVSEKNHQLTLMTRIYEDATCVVIYLGDSADGSDAAMDFIREIDIPSELEITKTEYVTLAKAHPGFTEEIESEEDSIHQELDRLALCALFRRPWFSRVWVLQEARMAQDLIVYCGDREVYWESFLAFKHWNVSSKIIKELPYVVTASPGRYSYLNPAQRLLRELHDTRDCEATDPRDKLFAILPLILQLEPNGADEEFQSMKVDYSLSATQVFVNLTKYFLSTLGIGIIGDVIGPSALAGLPSWVPDWSMKPTKQRFRNPSSLQSLDWSNTAPVIQANVRETRGVDNEPVYELHVEGSKVGSITLVGDECDLPKDLWPTTQWQSIMPEVKTLHNVYDRYTSERDLLCALLGTRALFLDKLEERVQIYFAGEEARSAIIQKLESRGRRLQPRVDTASTLADFCLAGYIASLFMFMQTILENCDSRRFFVTDTGFIGLGPKHTRVGDLTYFIKGVNKPCILRTCLTEASPVAKKESGERESGALDRLRFVGGCSVKDVPIEDYDSSFEKIVLW